MPPPHRFPLVTAVALALGAWALHMPGLALAQTATAKPADRGELQTVTVTVTANWRVEDVQRRPVWWRCFNPISTTPMRMPTWRRWPRRCGMNTTPSSMPA